MLTRRYYLLLLVDCLLSVLALILLAGMGEQWFVFLIGFRMIVALGFLICYEQQEVIKAQEAWIAFELEQVGLSPKAAVDTYPYRKEHGIW